MGMGANIMFGVLLLGNVFWLVAAMVERGKAQDWKQSREDWKESARGWERVAIENGATVERLRRKLTALNSAKADPEASEQTPIVRRHLRLVKY